MEKSKAKSTKVVFICYFTGVPSMNQFITAAQWFSSRQRDEAQGSTEDSGEFTLGSVEKGGMRDWSWIMERAQSLASEFQFGKYLALGNQKRLLITRLMWQYFRVNILPVHRMASQVDGRALRSPQADPGENHESLSVWRAGWMRMERKNLW